MTNPLRTLVIGVFGTKGSGRTTWVKQLGPVPVKYLWSYHAVSEQTGGAKVCLERIENAFVHEEMRREKRESSRIVRLAADGVDYAKVMQRLRVPPQVFNVDSLDSYKDLTVEQIPSLAGASTETKKLVLKQIYKECPCDPLATLAVLDRLPQPELLIIDGLTQLSQLGAIRDYLSNKWPADVYPVLVHAYAAATITDLDTVLDAPERPLFVVIGEAEIESTLTKFKTKLISNWPEITNLQQL